MFAIIPPVMQARKLQLWSTSGAHQLCHLHSTDSCQIALLVILLWHTAFYNTADMHTGISQVVTAVVHIIISLGPELYLDP